MLIMPTKIANTAPAESLFPDDCVLLLDPAEPESLVEDPEGGIVVVMSGAWEEVTIPPDVGLCVSVATTL